MHAIPWDSRIILIDGGIFRPDTGSERLLASSPKLLPISISIPALILFSESMRISSCAIVFFFCRIFSLISLVSFMSFPLMVSSLFCFDFIDRFPDSRQYCSFLRSLTSLSSSMAWFFSTVFLSLSDAMSPRMPSKRLSRESMVSFRDCRKSQSCCNSWRWDSAFTEL